jgi:hypothetical protein
MLGLLQFMPLRPLSTWLLLAAAVVVLMLEQVEVLVDI